MIDPPYRSAAAHDGNGPLIVADDGPKVVTSDQGTLSVQVTLMDPRASGRQWVVTVEATTKGGLVVPSTIHMNSGDRPASREEWKLFKSLVDRAWAEFDQAAAEAKARMR